MCESEPVLALSAEVAALRAAVSSALASNKNPSGDSAMAESVARVAMSLDELRAQARGYFPRISARCTAFLPC